MRGMSASSLGVADVPMRLLMAAVVTSIMIPLVWSAYSDLSINNTVASLEGEIRDLFENIEDVMDGGVGSTLTVRMELSSWGNAKIESVTVGGRVNDTTTSGRFLVTYSISGYGSGFMGMDPPLPLLSDEGIDLLEGIHLLKITHAISENVHYCYLEMK